MEQQVINEIVAGIMSRLGGPAGIPGIPVGVSNRHIHLSARHVEVLFGKGHCLAREKELKQTGEYAAGETVTLVGPKGVIRSVRVLGPVRNFTQIELSRTDGFTLGIVPPVRNSGDIAGSPGITVVGTDGSVTLTEGVICAARHIHMQPEDTARFGVAANEQVHVEFGGPRGGAFHNTVVRVSPNYRLEFHIDTDEANAAELHNGDLVTLRKCGHVTCTPEQSVKQLPLVSEAAKARVIDAETVRNAVRSGVRLIKVDRRTLITPLARDIARENHVEFSTHDR